MDLSDRQYARYAARLGVPLKVSSSGPYLEVSTDEPGQGIKMQALLRETELRYIKAHPRAASLRIDAPVVHQMIRLEGATVVEVPLATSMPIPEQLRYVRVGLAILDSPADDMETIEILATIQAHSAQTLTYELSGPVGLADFELVIADAFMAAEPVSEADCQGIHEKLPDEVEEYSGPLETIRSHMALRYQVCQRCLDHHAHLGFPLAPNTPKGWE